MEKVRLGIIGYGNMGSGHTRNILEGKCPEIEITAIADRKADRREGINGLMISNAMHLSSWLDHEVTLPIDEKKFYELLMERCKHSRHKEESGKTFATEGSY